MAASVEAQTIASSVVEYADFTQQGVDVGQHTSSAVVSGNPAVAYYDVTHHALKYARNNTVDGSAAWTVCAVDQSADVGQYASLTVVNGNPAICYYDATNGDLKYARNSQADGFGVWTITTVDTGGDVGRYASMTLVSGNPAISYYDVTNGDLKFARNSAADGSGTWSITPVDTAGDTGQFTSLAVISGVPCISYQDVTDGFLKFARNSNATGTGTWTSVSVSTMTVTGQYTTLISVSGGRPAISYYSVTATRQIYAVSSNTAGSAGSWTATPVSSGGTQGQYSSMIVTATGPVICYYNATNGDLAFARNSQTDGSGTWTLGTVDTTGDVGRFASMAIVNGNPAVTYYDVTNGDLKFARNSAANGSGAWSLRTVDGPSYTPGISSQALVNGKPAIAYGADSYLGGGIIKFARNSAADGSGTWAVTAIDSLDTNGEGMASLAMAGGNPAIAYVSNTSGVVFARAPTTDGSGTWTRTTGLDASSSSLNTEIILGTAAGNPAVAFLSAEAAGQSIPTLISNSAADGSGTWTAFEAANHSAAETVWHGISLATVAGKPAISGYNISAHTLKFTRCNAADGSGTWNISTVDTVGNITQDSSSFLYPNTALAIVNGTPAICYFDGTQHQLKFARNSAADGSGTWAITTLDNNVGNALQRVSLNVFNGVVAASYVDSQSKVVCIYNTTSDATGAWVKLTLSGAPNYAAIPSLVLLANGMPASSCFPGSTGDLQWIRGSSHQLVLEQPIGTSVGNGGSRNIAAAFGFSTDAVFAARNWGIAETYTGLTAAIDGANASDFSITASPASTLSGPLGATVFTVRFNPATMGAKAATLHVTNTLDASSFDVTLNGTPLSFTQDTDGDGLNDATEFQLASLGFDWQVAQPALVNTFFANVSRALPDVGASGHLPDLNASGYYTQSQLQALHVNTPMIGKNPGTGQFKLTIGAEKSTDLIHFNPFPFVAPQVIINAQGQIEFQFSVSDNAAFFLLQSH